MTNIPTMSPEPQKSASPANPQQTQGNPQQGNPQQNQGNPQQGGNKPGADKPAHQNLPPSLCHRSARGCRRAFEWS